MSDLGLSASCGCYVTSLSGRANVSLCREHSDRLLPIFDGPPGQVDGALVDLFGDLGIEPTLEDA